MIVSGGRGARTDGFALTELVLALCVMALIATLALPGLPHAGGSASLRATAFQIAALLRDVRTQAATGGRPASIQFGGGERRLRASNGLSLDIPAGVEIAASDGLPGIIGFSPDGHSSGGTIVLQGVSSRRAVTVGADTGAIRVVAP